MTATVIIHSLEHARAALTAAKGLACPVVLESAPEAAASLGAGVFREMITVAREAVPGAESLAVLDCGSDPGRALNALRLGVEAVRLEAPPDVLARIADIAEQSGARVLSGPRDAALDLLDLADAENACREWLISKKS